MFFRYHNNWIITKEKEIGVIFNSLEIIKDFQKNDERILLISQDSNVGKMKSRADGIRKAKGKYITIIDGDDAFIHKDILKNCLYIFSLFYYLNYS